MIQPGRLRHVVRFEQRSPQLDGAGQATETWLLFAARWAEKLKTPGSEIWSSEQESARVPTVFRLRPLVIGNQPVDLGVLPAMRLVCRGKVYHIKSAIDPTNVGEELLVTTEEWPEAVP